MRAGVRYEALDLCELRGVGDAAGRAPVVGGAVDVRIGASVVHEGLTLHGGSHEEVLGHLPCGDELVASPGEAVCRLAEC